MHPADFGGGYLNLAKTFDTLLAATRGLSPSAGSPLVHPFFSPLFPPPPPSLPQAAYPLHNPLLPLIHAGPPTGFPVLGFPSPPLPQQHSRFSLIPNNNASLVIRADDEEEIDALNHV